MIQAPVLQSLHHGAVERLGLLGFSGTMRPERG
jgi:hypothetical protein